MKTYNEEPVITFGEELPVEKDCVFSKNFIIFTRAGKEVGRIDAMFHLDELPPDALEYLKGVLRPMKIALTVPEEEDDH